MNTTIREKKYTRKQYQSENGMMGDISFVRIAVEDHIQELEALKR